MYCIPSTKNTATENYMPPDERRYAQLTESSLAELEQATQKAVSNGIREGLKSVIIDEEYMEAFWSGGLKLAKKQATMKAGTLLMDSFTAILKRTATVMFIGMIMYYVGGWDLAARVLKFFFTGDK